ncbi:phage minor head protein [Rhodoferax sp.]|uniref:phage head morphogenesis protein n=1 Tax=Rhodoferax sp. TaxID=50421 RepID=UPI00262A5841|nr:phage minor head protein [Rhodoferax sp.]MDD3938038.1 phage minor head protein [Rhodoferax sp.]
MPGKTARPEPSAALVAQFKAPFAEQVAFFRGKLGNLVPTARWDDLWQAQHDKAFMVAGAAKADLLADLAGAVDKAVAEGETLDKFRQRFEEIVGQHGWHGWTGEGSKAGQDWRTRIIYQTNLATSYSAGRLAQLRAAGYTHYMYKHSDSVLHPRPEHVALNGVVEPAESDFWKRYYPPSAWGCRCRALGVRGPAQAKRLGGQWDKGAPGWTHDTNPKTGAPPGIDRGWAYAPGGSVADTVRALVPKLNQLPAKPSVALMQDWLKTDAFSRWYDAPTGAWPMVRLPAVDLAALGAAIGVRVAQMSSETAIKQKQHHPDLSAQDYLAAQQVIDQASAKASKTNPTGTTSMIYIQEVQGYVLVVKATADKTGLYVTSYYRLHAAEARRTGEIARLLRQGKKE